MGNLNKLLWTFLFGTLAVGGFAAQPAPDSVMTFKFVSGNDMFYVPYAGNSAELSRLYGMVEQYRKEIASGGMPVYVSGYCASKPTESENLRVARTRSNRVKSELITHKGLKEANFVTRNYGRTYEGKKDIVVVTLRIPEQAMPADTLPNEVGCVPSEKQPVKETVKAESDAVAESVAKSEPCLDKPAGKSGYPYRVAVRTNLLYDAFALPTLGLEWRVTPEIGIKVDGSYAFWGSEHGNVQKIWMVSPELRWFLLKKKRFYTGLSANVGEYNVCGYPVGKLFSKDTGYQGKFWNAGLSVGYQLYLSGAFSIDFNLGLGYARFDYDNFSVIDGTRVYKEKDKVKSFWGPTQAGISLMWTIGRGK